MSPPARPPADHQAVLDALPVTVFRVGPDMRLLYANRRGAEQVGRAPAEVVGRTCSELGMPEADYGRWQGYVEEAFRTGEPGWFQYKADGGRERLVEYRFVPEPGPGGAVGSVLVAALVNDEVRHLRAALGGQQELFRLFMDHVPGIAWLRDEAGRYMFVSRGYVEALGPDAADRVGRTPEEVWPADVAAVFRANDAAVLASGRPLQVVEPAPDPGGAVRTWLNVKFPFVGPDGTRYVGGVGVDVTDREREADERRRLDARVAEAQRLDSLGLLAAGAAHDFNNLLTVIGGSAALAAQDVPPGSPAAAHLARVEEACGRAAELCGQMLAFAGRGPARRPGPVDLNRVARETAGLVRAVLPAGVDLRLDLAAALPPVRGDETQLRQVVLNLLTNAAEAMAGRAGEVGVSTRPGPPGWVELVVADAGVGMSAEVQARVFDPFFTTKPTGRGLGLAAVQGIVRSAGGAIEVESAAGQGTTFRVRLPAGS
ncbi:MAG: PAS domain-containing protein [Gemmataceae bacterium]|nr:PAS domain-containing protein [Gemmataceae bacterium]